MVAEVNPPRGYWEYKGPGRTEFVPVESQGPVDEQYDRKRHYLAWDEKTRALRPTPFPEKQVPTRYNSGKS